MDLIVCDNNGRRIEKIPEGILECPSEARDWHTTLSKGVRIRCPPFFFGPPFVYASPCAVCVWTRSGNRGGSRKWLLGVIWQAEEPASPESTWTFSVVVCVSTYSAMPGACRHNGRISRFEPIQPMYQRCVARFRFTPHLNLAGFQLALITSPLGALPYRQVLTDQFKAVVVNFVSPRLRSRDPDISFDVIYVNF